VSTLIYEAITSAREATQPQNALMVREAATPGEGTKIPKLVDSVAALVPVEVLAAHAAVLGVVATTSDPGDKGPVVVTITEDGWATGAWFVLLGVALLFYVVPHVVKGKWDGWDWLRMLIPPVAFAAWTMLAKGTLFDAVNDWDSLTRTLVAVAIGLAALLASQATAEEAEKKPNRGS
jgi:peptidoglycan/LPS O-acetylase OafA/YrhL